MVARTVVPPEPHLRPPVLRKGRMFCPRCDARVLYDGEDFVCMACGYQYTPEAREVARYLAHASHRRRTGAATTLSIGAGVLAGLTLGKLSLAVPLGALVVLIGGEIARGLARRRRGARR